MFSNFLVGFEQVEAIKQRNGHRSVCVKPAEIPQPQNGRAQSYIICEANDANKEMLLLLSISSRKIAISRLLF